MKSQEQRDVMSRQCWSSRRPRKWFFLSLLVHYFIGSLVILAMCLFQKDPLGETILRTTVGCPMVFIGWILIIANGADPYWHIVFPLIPICIIAVSVWCANRLALWVLNVVFTPLNIWFAVLVGNFARDWNWG